MSREDPPTLICLPYDGVHPAFASSPRFCGRGAAVLGRARVGADAWLGHYAVLRADGHDIRIGDRAHFGHHATVHIADSVYPAHVGHHVSVGNDAVVHACEIGDECVIEDGATVLDGAVVGKGSIIERDAVVYPRARLAPGQRYAGNPAQPISAVDGAELAARHAAMRSYAERTAPFMTPKPSSGSPKCGAGVFVAPGVRVAGKIELGGQANIWFGCDLSGGGRGIRIGVGANVQDNSFLFSVTGELVLEEEVTIGHNVFMQDCRVLAGSLVGISSYLAPGTVVESDVLVAAGAVTTPGQVLESGFLWGGRPARRIRPLDDAMRAVMREVPVIYRSYAAQFGARAAQRQRAAVET